MKRISIILFTLAIALMAATGASPKVKRTNKNSLAQLPENLNELMRAPSIMTNTEGYYCINRDAPRTLPHLKVVTKEIDGWERMAKIYVNGKLAQTLKYESTVDEIKFFDANFDGYVDILFGAACPREYSAIFLWKPSSKKFIQAMDEDEGRFNGLMVVNPDKKELYCYLSGGAFMNGYSISKWNGNILETIESFYEYTEEGEGTEYNVLDKKGQTLMKTRKFSSVPSKWRSIMNNVNACFQDY